MWLCFFILTKPLFVDSKIRMNLMTFDVLFYRTSKLVVFSRSEHEWRSDLTTARNPKFLPRSFPPQVWVSIFGFPHVEWLCCIYINQLPNYPLLMPQMEVTRFQAVEFSNFINLASTRGVCVDWPTKVVAQELPSLKLTEHLKMDGWNTSFLLGMAHFQGLC